MGGVQGRFKGPACRSCAIEWPRLRLMFIHIVGVGGANRKARGSLAGQTSGMGTLNRMATSRRQWLAAPSTAVSRMAPSLPKATGRASAPQSLPRSRRWRGGLARSSPPSPCMRGWTGAVRPRAAARSPAAAIGAGARCARTSDSAATILAQQGNAVGLRTVDGQGAELRGAVAEGVHASGARVPHKSVADFVFERPPVRLRLGLKASEHVSADSTDGDFGHVLPRQSRCRRRKGRTCGCECACHATPMAPNRLYPPADDTPAPSPPSNFRRISA